MLMGWWMMKLYSALFAYGRKAYIGEYHDKQAFLFLDERGCHLTKYSPEESQCTILGIDKLYSALFSLQ